MKQIYLILGRAGVIGFALLLFGCKGGGVPNSSQAAPFLPERNEQGDYSPYYNTGEMNEPRYLHQTIRLKNGLVLVSGGTDERGFSAFDSGELFDETGIRKGELIPPSKTGVWLDTDFEGEPIAMEFRRLWHTMTILPDNRVIVIGGAGNFLRAAPVGKVEIFDPEKRQFETLEDVEMVTPRVRHSANLIQDGNILIAGGQIQDVFVDITQGTVTGTSGMSGSGTITVAQQIIIFPTIDEVEIFNFRDLDFSELTFPDTTRASTLSSSRGRAGHTATRFAGPDNRLNTGDDLYLLVGGFQTSSAPQLIPTFMVPRAGGVGVLSMRNLEVFDPTLNIFSQVGSILIDSPRVNDPQATNLGIFNQRTIDDVLGLGNLILVTHGDNNSGCWTTPAVDELLSAVYTGFGPAQGLLFNKIPGDNADGEDGHVQNVEWETNQQNLEPLPAAPIFLRGRSMTNIVALPRTLESRTRPGQNVLSSWIFAGAGVAFTCAPPPCTPCAYYDGTIAAGALFDPFYRLIPTADFNLSPIPDPRDLEPTRNENINPTGVIGCWLALDGKLPSHDRIGFADVQPAIWAHNAVNRVYTALVAVAGEDGIIDTTDDRILFTGGGQDGLDFGGEASVPSCELAIIPQSPP